MRTFLLSGHTPHSVHTGGCFFREIAVGFEVKGTSPIDAVERMLAAVPSLHKICFDCSVFNEAQRNSGLHQFDRVLWKII
jgi:hypothetical protein